jgi:ABC-type cobalt transport system substrate-binding protein
MIIQIDLMEAVLIIQSIEATDWQYCGEDGRAAKVVAKIRSAAQAEAHEIDKHQSKTV